MERISYDYIKAFAFKKGIGKARALKKEEKTVLQRKNVLENILVKLQRKNVLENILMKVQFG